ncbi:hypothetical protein Tco_0775209 [Tanacetum coccineum]
MSTRSTSTDLVPPFSDPESVIQNRRRNLDDPSLLLDFKEIHMANNNNKVQGPPPAGPNIPAPDLCPMEELLQAPTDGVGDAIVVPPFLLCPHHYFSPLHQIDTFYNALNQSDQDSLNSAAGGNFLTRNTQEALTIIENKFKLDPHFHLPLLLLRRWNEIRRNDNQPSTPDECTTHVPHPIVQPSPISRSFDLPSPVSLPSEPPKWNPHQPPIPYPSRLNKEKLQDKSDIQVHKFFQMFKKLHFNISLVEALALMPKYHKMLKDLLSDKEKLLGLVNTSLIENCFSRSFLKKLSRKLGDLRKFSHSLCDFPKLEKCMALADLGANINLMPLSVWKKLMLPKLESLFSADFFVVDYFVVVDYDVDPRVPLILGRPFLRTDHALVDHGNESINMINFIDITCEDRFDEVLKIQKSIHCLSGSPTPSDLVVYSLVEETDILLSHFNDSSPDYETFCFDIEEKSSGSITSHSYHYLPEYESFCFDVDHIEEKSSGSTISHFDLSLLEYESFHFDLSTDQPPPADRSDFYHKEFADELAHIISPPENKDKVFDPGIFTINGVHSKRFSILLLDDFSSIVFVRYFLFLTDPSEIETFLSFPSRNEDKVIVMDLFSFIHHADPIKVRVDEIERADGQVPLLEATRGRVVPLAPLASVTTVSSEGNMTESIDRLFDEGYGVEKEHSTGGGDYVALTETIIKPVNKDVAEEPRRLKKKRKATRDASGSTLPSKKLKEDYDTSGASASTGGKSRDAIQSLLDNSRLSAEIGVTAATTMPLVTSFVTLTPEREGGGGDRTDSVSGPNLRTIPPAARFVISSNSSHRSSTHVVDVEVSSLIKSAVLDPPVMTAAVTTTAVMETSLVSMPKAKAKPVNPTLFGDCVSSSGHDVSGPSSLVHPDLFADSFYAVQDLNPKTLHRVYVPKRTVTNESVLDDPYICHSLTDQLAPTLFSLLSTMEYDQLYAEFNVGAARQTCLGAEVKVLVSLKEAEAAEAICLHGHVANIEATEAIHAAELNLLKERNSSLEAKMRSSEEKVAALDSAASVRENKFSSLAASADQLSYDFSLLQTAFNELSVKVVALEFEKSGLTNQTTCAGLRNQVAGNEHFKEQIEAEQDEQVRVLIEKVAKVDVPSIAQILIRLGKAIGRAVNKGMQDGLAAGIEHGKTGRDLSDVATYNPSADADYVAAVSATRDVDFPLLTLLAFQKDAIIADIMDSLRLEGPAAEAPDAGELQPSHEQFMLLIHRPEDNVILGETSLSFSLDVTRNRIKRIRGDAKAHRLSLSDAMVPLIEPLSSDNLLVPSLSVADYGVVHAEPQVEDPSFDGVVFEKEELATSPEPTVDG